MIEIQAQLRRGDFNLDIDFTAPAGVTVLFGRSGSGKTTAADLIAGLTRPDSGRIVIAGETVWDATTRQHQPAWRRRVGYVFQDARLFPHLSVRDNLLYGARRRGVPVPALGETVGLLGLENRLAHRPGMLSGGEARRVAIGRALLSEPDLLILDEPLSGLDGARRAEILPYLDRLARSGPPILYVTHSVDEAARLADEVVLAVDGNLRNAGPPHAAFAVPQAVEATGLGVPVAVLQGRALAGHDGRVASADLGGTVFHTPLLDVAPGERVRIIVDARDVALARTAPADASFQNQLAARIVAIEPWTQGHLVQLAGPNWSLSSLVTDQAVEALGLAPGVEVVALVKATAAARYA